MSKPRVLAKCVANNYVGKDERTIEFASCHGGGLINFRETQNNKLRIQLYRLDPDIDVDVSYDTGVSITSYGKTAKRIATKAQITELERDFGPAATQTILAILDLAHPE